LAIRRPAVAGAFYAGSEGALRRQIEWCFRHALGPGDVPKPSEGALKKLVALVCPHAGYMYSGPVAAHSYARLAKEGKPDVAIILGPNHTGFGSAVAISVSGAWRTPLGDVEIDTAVAEAIMDKADVMSLDDGAHLYEHSIEVQLPFLQFLYGSDFKLVPICMMLQGLQTSSEVGSAIAKVVRELDLNVIIIASTDLTHYEPQHVAERKDRAVIEAVERLDVPGLYEVVEELPVSMCGYGPTATAMVAAKELGAARGELLKYATSGDITGDKSSVVGYASIALVR